MRTSSIPSGVIIKNQLRFESNYYLNEHSFNSIIVEKMRDSCVLLSSIADVFNPTIFKRQFCRSTNNSVQYFQSSDITYASECSSIYVSKKQAESLNLLVRKHDILITGFGTIGNTRLVSKFQDGVCYANNVCRVRLNPNIYVGFIYAFLSSKFGFSQLNKNASGSVVRYIEAPGIKRTLIPNLCPDFQKEINELIIESARLREEATANLFAAERMLKEKANLPELTSELYDYYGPSDCQRKVSCFTRNIKDIGVTSLNAFNHSERIRNLKSSITCPSIPLKKALKGERTFGTSSLPNIEVKPGHGIMLINQKDMFDNIVKGKWISSKGSKPENVVEYGEILIACDGTLGESELFCRAVFANEDLTGSYVSSHFLRLKVNEKYMAGYLYCWLNSDYGFRLIRSTQSGTKICHPINVLFLQIPVPLIDYESMVLIDNLVREAHTKRHQANQIEKKAINMVEQKVYQLAVN